MKMPSPNAHFYRLAIVFFVFILVFLVVRQIATPASWNYDLTNWYRLDALEELKQQPVVFGDNPSCVSCHEWSVETVMEDKHAGLSCESCHGPLANHARGEEKIADAVLAYGMPGHLEGKTNPVIWQCQNCHEATINKPKTVPQYTASGKFKTHIKFEAGGYRPGTDCLKCHGAHEPTP